MSVAVRTHPRGRVCAGGCGTILSIYNDEDFCSSCDPPPSLVVAKQEPAADLLAEAEQALAEAREARRRKVREQAYAEARWWAKVGRWYR